MRWKRTIRSTFKPTENENFPLNFWQSFFFFIRTYFVTDSISLIKKDCLLAHFVLSVCQIIFYFILRSLFSLTKLLIFWDGIIYILLLYFKKTAESVRTLCPLVPKPTPTLLYSYIGILTIYDVFFLLFFFFNSHSSMLFIWLMKLRTSFWLSWFSILNIPFYFIEKWLLPFSTLSY